MSDEIEIRKVIQSLPGYKAGNQAQEVPGLIPYKLSSNENPVEPLPSVVSVIAQAALTVHRYPDPSASALTESISKFCGVDSEQIATGTGSVGVCQQIIQALCDADDEVIFAWRSFEAYPIITAIAGAKSVKVALTSSGDHDLPAMLTSITDKTRIIFICTPNNPTGNIVKHDDLVEFLEHVPSEVLVVIDEAYIEFNRDNSAVDSQKIIQAYPNVGLLRTFSKAYGLAGLRVGYFVGPQLVAEAVRKTAVPFGVSHVAQVAAIESLNNKDELMQRVESIVQTREWFEGQLRNLGFDLPDSQANFVWLALGERATDFATACNDVAVAVRPFAGLGVRISIGEKEALERVLQVARNFVVN